MSFHTSVHHRLRIARLITLVVAQTAKADEIENNVLVKLVPVFKRDLDHAKRRLRVVAVDVKDRRLCDLSGIGRVDRAAAKFGRRGKSDLIVNNDVNGAARTIARRVRELKRFHYDSLSGKCGVAVKQDGHYPVKSLFARTAL